jgi:hypothetical protein
MIALRHTRVARAVSVASVDTLLTPPRCCIAAWGPVIDSFAKLRARVMFKQPNRQTKAEEERGERVRESEVIAFGA